MSNYSWMYTFPPDRIGFCVLHMLEISSPGPWPGCRRRRYRAVAGNSKQHDGEIEQQHALSDGWGDKFYAPPAPELNILKFTDGRKTRNGDLFKKVARKMEEAGFTRTPEQVRSNGRTTRKLTMAPNTITRQVVGSVLLVCFTSCWKSSWGGDL